LDENNKMNNYSNINFYFGHKIPTITIMLGKEITTENVDTFLKHYHFSRFKKGQFFLKRLIKKIIAKKITHQTKISANFFEDIEVKLMQISIKYENKAINSVKKSLISNQSNRRIKNIEKYETLIKENVDLGFPLYIQRDCLKKINTNIENGPPIQLDGSRRLMANVLNKKEKYYIWLITLKENQQ